MFKSLARFAVFFLVPCLVSSSVDAAGIVNYVGQILSFIWLMIIFIAPPALAWLHNPAVTHDRFSPLKLAALLGFGMLTMGRIHELGHYWAAKWLHVKTVSLHYSEVQLGEDEFKLKPGQYAFIAIAGPLWHVLYAGVYLSIALMFQTNSFLFVAAFIFVCVVFNFFPFLSHDQHPSDGSLLYYYFWDWAQTHLVRAHIPNVIWINHVFLRSGFILTYQNRLHEPKNIRAETLDKLLSLSSPLIPVDTRGKLLSLQYLNQIIETIESDPQWTFLLDSSNVQQKITHIRNAIRAGEIKWPPKKSTGQPANGRTSTEIPKPELEAA